MRVVRACACENARVNDCAKMYLKLGERKRKVKNIHGRL